MKRFLSTLTAVLVSGAIALAAALPNIPSSPTYSEASQIVGTLNALINQLNGGAGYAGAAQNVSLGSFCTGTSTSGAVTCNGQRGVLSFTSTAISVGAQGTVQTITLTDSSVLATSSCFAQWQSAFTAGSALYAATIVPTANTLTMIVANGGATTNTVQTGTLAFQCL